jgi:hypothetical protein
MYENPRKFRLRRCFAAKTYFAIFWAPLNGKYPRGKLFIQDNLSTKVVENLIAVILVGNLSNLLHYKCSYSVKTAQFIAKTEKKSQ